MLNRKFILLLPLGGLIFVLYQNFGSIASTEPVKLQPDLVYPLQQVSLTTPPNGALQRTQDDDLSLGWSTATSLLGGFVNMYNPKILKSGSASYPYEMWFFGWASQACNQPIATATYCDSIFYGRARTIQGPWEVYSGVVNGAPTFAPMSQISSWVPIIHARDKYWDNWHNGDPSVVKVNGIYFMAYSQTGANQNGKYPQVTSPDLGINNESIGGAYSLDGIRWTRLDRPLLVSMQDPMNGQKPPGAGYARPSLMYENSKFRLWFDYDAGPEHGISMGYAELPGPASIETFKNSVFSLVQGDKNPAIAQWPNPNIIRVEDLYISVSDSLSLWVTGVNDWAKRQPSFAISRDGIKWTVVGHINPDPDCTTNMVPELYAETGNIYLTTGCVRKIPPEVLEFFTPEQREEMLKRGKMTSIRLKQISYQKLRQSFVQVLNRKQNTFFTVPATPIALIPRPACVASVTDQIYLQTAEKFFAANVSTQAQNVVIDCVIALRQNLQNLRSLKWVCNKTSEVIQQTLQCVNEVVRVISTPYETLKYNAGNKFVEAFTALQNAKKSGVTGAQLLTLVNACQVAQTNAQNYGVAVSAYTCK